MQNKLVRCGPGAPYGLWSVLFLAGAASTGDPARAPSPLKGSGEWVQKYQPWGVVPQRVGHTAPGLVRFGCGFVALSLGKLDNLFKVQLLKL